MPLRKKKRKNIPDDNIYNEDIVTPGEMASSQKITVGVAGICQRMGTTTQAVQIALYLFFKGKNVAYVEMNGSGFIDALKETYADTKEDKNGNLVYERLTLVKEGNLRTVTGKEYDCLVFDYGSRKMKTFNQASFSERNVQVLVAGSSPQEIMDTTAALTDKTFERSRILFNLVPETDRGAIEEMMTKRKSDTFFTSYVPDMFVSDKGMDRVYGQIMPEALT